MLKLIFNKDDLKLWLVNRASQNMALAGPTAVWVASGQREARPLYGISVVPISGTK